MKVRELIEKLQTFDPEMEVLRWAEDGAKFDIMDVYAPEGRVIID